MMVMTNLMWDSCPQFSLDPMSQVGDKIMSPIRVQFGFRAIEPSWWWDPQPRGIGREKSNGSDDARLKKLGPF